MKRKKKRIPFIMEGLSLLASNQLHAAYTVRLNKVGDNLANIARSEESRPSYDRTVFPDAFHGYTFTSPAEKKAVTQDIIRAIKNCSATDENGNICIFTDAYIGNQHSYYKVLLDIEELDIRRQSDKIIEQDRQSMRHQLYSNASHLETRIRKIFSKNHASSPLSKMLGVIEKSSAKWAQRDTTARAQASIWIEQNGEDLDTTEDFIRVISQSPPPVPLAPVFWQLCEQNHPIVQKLRSSLAHERKLLGHGA